MDFGPVLIWDKRKAHSTVYHLLDFVIILTFVGLLAARNLSPAKQVVPMQEKGKHSRKLSCRLVVGEWNSVEESKLGEMTSEIFNQKRLEMEDYDNAGISKA